MTTDPKLCETCGKDITGTHGSRKYCNPCAAINQDYGSKEKPKDKPKKSIIDKFGIEWRPGAVTDEIFNL